MCGPLFSIRFFLIALMAMLVQAAALAAQEAEPSPEGPGAAGICYGQPDLTEKELQQALAVMRAIVNEKGRLSPEEEEAIIAEKKLASSRLNCLMGKIMAANDVFGWGGSQDYGVPLTKKEERIAKKYKNDSRMLKRYLEEVLNIKVE